MCNSLALPFAAFPQCWLHCFLCRSSADEAHCDIAERLGSGGGDRPGQQAADPVPDDKQDLCNQPHVKDPPCSLQ